MKILQRYIFIELFKLFCVSVLFLTSLLFLDKFFFMAQLMLEKSVTMVEMLRIIGYISPSFLALTIPVSIFAATVIGFNQFSVSNEIDAMKASGFSFLYMLKPAMAIGFLAYIVCNIIVFYALPWGNKSFTELILHIVKTRANIDIKPMVFNTDFKNITIYAKSKESDNTYTDIFVADNSSSVFSKVILSKKAILTTDPGSLTVHLKLFDGTIHDQSQKGKAYKLMKFDKYSVSLKFPGFIDLRDRIFIGNRELSFSDLREKIKNSNHSGKKSNKLKITLSKKFSLPITCLLFAMAGAPLGVRSRRSGKSAGYVISVLGILAYYIVLNTMANLGGLGKINPYISVWIPNIILFALTTFMVYRVQRGIPFVAFDRIYDSLALTYDYIRNIYFRLLERKSAIQKKNPAAPET